MLEQADTVIVFGAGTVGLMTAAMARASGASTVLIADVDHGRVQYALRNGFATKGYVVPPRRPLKETTEKFTAAKEQAAEMVEIACEDDMDVEGADVTFDCTGKEFCMQAGLYVSCPTFTMVHILTLCRQQDPAENSSWLVWAHPHRHYRCLPPT